MARQLKEGDEITGELMPSGNGEGAATPEQQKAWEEERKALDEAKANEKISGHRVMYGVVKTFLPEVSRLDRMEVYGFAAGDARDAVLDTSPDRPSIYEIFKESLMRNHIGEDGQAREEYIRLKLGEAQQQINDMNRGASFDRSGL